MGMYTEILVDVDFISTLPAEVVCVIKAMCEGEWGNECLLDKPDRWGGLFLSGSYYCTNTSCSNFTFDRISNSWSLVAKGNIKNYENEIEQFFKYIAPYVVGDFMGYMRYEEEPLPRIAITSDFT